MINLIKRFVRVNEFKSKLEIVLREWDFKIIFKKVVLFRIVGSVEILYNEVRVIDIGWVNFLI